MDRGLQSDELSKVEQEMFLADLAYATWHIYSRDGSTMLYVM
jgi:hypothetical protein